MLEDFPLTYVTDRLVHADSEDFPVLDPTELHSGRFVPDCFCHLLVRSKDLSKRVLVKVTPLGANAPLLQPMCAKLSDGWIQGTHKH
jgi:hypothetical protein